VILTRGSRGRQVEALQLALAGFRGTLPDGDFGPGTELQVRQFERDYMGRTPTGIADRPLIAALQRFAKQYPIDFKALRCPCGDCGGFGRSRGRGEYLAGQPRVEAFHQYEYPGIHRMLLWAYRGAMFYVEQGMRGKRLVPTSGYRCQTRNAQRGRTSSNHMGKAIDLDIPLTPGQDKRDDMRQCDEVRALLVETAAAQIGWGAQNRKALEPASIAPTWVHYDVRCYSARYLEDRFFVQSPIGLDQDLDVLTGVVTVQ
jgi:hypothetical protein